MGGNFCVLSEVTLPSGQECVSLCLLPTPAMWLPCGALKLASDDSARPWEKKGMFSLLGAGSEGEVEEVAFEGSAGPGRVAAAFTEISQVLGGQMLHFGFILHHLCRVRAVLEYLFAAAYT